MTEESSADGEDREGGEEPPADADLAPAGEGDPDVEAAKADLEAVGRDDEPDDDDGDPGAQAQDAGEDPASSGGDPNSAPSGGEHAAAAAGDDEDATQQPEDLVRDPDASPVGRASDAADDDGAVTEADAEADAEAEAEAEADASAETEDEQEAEADAEVDADADSDAEADAAAETEADAQAEAESDATADPQPGVPEDVQTYDRFTKVDGAQYERVNDFLRDRTYITAREWAIARLCSDFRTETGVEMTKIGENLPELVPFMTDTYTAQAVNQARASFEEKVRTAGATFLYGAMCDFFTAEELDDLMYESTEVAKFLLEVEGVELSVEEELEAEDRISSVMREVREQSAELRHERCPECGAELSGGE